MELPRSLNQASRHLRYVQSTLHGQPFVAVAGDPAPHTKGAPHRGWMRAGTGSMGGGGSKPQVQALAEHDVKRLTRKCRSLNTAYTKCMVVNKTDPKACDNLETALVTCWWVSLWVVCLDWLQGPHR